ncbi:MAG: BON domain-containing protein, partial [Planctomycetaceae bacterium]|nr:BON domain-containing protein [Planctomycetaceae bacterium]
RRAFMRKYGKWLLVLGVLAANPAWVRADGFLQGLRQNAAQQSSTKEQNQQLAEQIKIALQQARLNAYDVEIEVRNGVVTLEGKVRDMSHRALATQQCLRVAGVRDVQNNLKFVPGGDIRQVSAVAPEQDVRHAAYQFDDSEVNTIQQTRFTKPAKRSATPPQQQHQQPQQQQSGNRRPVQPVQAAYGSDNAEPVAAQPALTPPPIAMTPSAPPSPEPLVRTSAAKPTVPAGVSNQQVAQQIADSLESQGLSGYPIEIRYENGIATLLGEVSTTQQYQAAGFAAGRVSQVRDVQNNLQVAGPIAQTSFAPQGRVAPASMTYAQPGMMAAQPTAVGGAGMYSNPHLPSHAWPAYAQYPNSAAISYPSQYSASAWPYIGPFYPYPQVPLGWREATLRWDDGFWQLDFEEKHDAWYWLFSPKNWH